MPSEQKAAVLPAAKQLHEVRSLPVPKPQKGEVLVKVTAAAINPVDWKIRDYGLFITEFPAVLGGDAAGVVEALGEGVTKLKVGDRVFFQGKIGVLASSTFQQYATIEEKLASKSPSGFSDEQLSTIQLAAMAVVVGYYDTTGAAIKPAPWDKGGDSFGAGKAIVILGGSSSVGQYAISLARLSGFSKIITSSSPSNHAKLQKLGATHVLDRNTAKPADYVAAAGGDEIHFVYDAISEDATITVGVQVLGDAKSKSQTKTVVTVLDPSEPVAAEAKKHGVEVKRILGIGSAPNLRYISEPWIAAISGDDGWVAKGKIVPNEPLVVPGGLGGLEEALAKNKKGVSGVKVVIQPHAA